MVIFRATHVIELNDGQHSTPVALRLVSGAETGVQVYRDVFANEYVVDSLLGCDQWPKHTHALKLEAEQTVPLSWLRSAKVRSCSFLPSYACV